MKSWKRPGSSPILVPGSYGQSRWQSPTHATMSLTSTAPLKQGRNPRELPWNQTHTLRCSSWPKFIAQASTLNWYTSPPSNLSTNCAGSNIVQEKWIPRSCMIKKLMNTWREDKPQWPHMWQLDKQLITPSKIITSFIIYKIFT